MWLFRTLPNLFIRVGKTLFAGPEAPEQAEPLPPTQADPKPPNQLLEVGQSEHSWRGAEHRGRSLRTGHVELGSQQTSDSLPWFFERKLAFQGETLSDVSAFLASCRYVNDTDHFKRPDWWIHPVEFEELKRGDCEDHALWAWRVLHDMGHDVRLMIGLCQGEGHAWVQLYADEKSYVLEATAKCDVLATGASDYMPEYSFKRMSDESFMMYGHKPETSKASGRIPVDPPPSPEDWVKIDCLIFACKKTEAHRTIRIAMQGKGSYTRQFLDRYFYLREHHPDAFDLDDEAYWEDWKV